MIISHVGQSANVSLDGAAPAVCLVRRKVRLATISTAKPDKRDDIGILFDCVADFRIGWLSDAPPAGSLIPRFTGFLNRGLRETRLNGVIDCGSANWRRTGRRLAARNPSASPRRRV